MSSIIKIIYSVKIYNFNLIKLKLDKNNLLSSIFKEYYCTNLVK